MVVDEECRREEREYKTSLSSSTMTIEKANPPVLKKTAAETGRGCPLSARPCSATFTAVKGDHFGVLRTQRFEQLCRIGERTPLRTTPLKSTPTTTGRRATIKRRRIKVVVVVDHSCNTQSDDV